MIFKFNHWQNHPRYSRWEICAKRMVTRMTDIQVSHHISSEMGRKLIAKPTTTCLWLSQACKQPITRPKLWKNGSRHQLWATTSDVWKRKYQNAFNHSRQHWRGDFKFDRSISSGCGNTTSSNSSFSRILQQNLFQTHQEESTMYSLIFPKDPNCEVCARTKVTRAPCRRKSWPPGGQSKKCRKIWRYDHSRPQGSQWRSRVATASQTCSSQPWKTKSAQETQRRLRKSLRPEENPRSIFCDNSLEFIGACEELNWNHERSTPHRSATNGIAERPVWRVKVGTSSVLVQSGLQENWWVEAMEWYDFLRNVQDLLAEVQTPYERLFSSPFEGPTIHFRAEVKFHPFPSKDQCRVHQFGKKVLPGICMGYTWNAGGSWTGDLFTADTKDSKTMPASEITVIRFKSKEVAVPKRNDEFVFPCITEEILQERQP